MRETNHWQDWLRNKDRSWKNKMKKGRDTDTVEMKNHKKAFEEFYAKI